MVRALPRILADGLFARALLARAAVIWVLVRVAVIVIEFFVQGVTPEPFVPPHVAAVAVAVVASLMLVDVRRRGEHVLLANLGTSTGGIAMLGAGCALALELVTAGVGALVTTGAA